MKLLFQLLIILSFSTKGFAQSFIENGAIRAYHAYSFNEVININKSLVDKGNRNKVILEKLANAYYLTADYKHASYYYNMLFSNHDSLMINDVYRYYQTLRSVNEYEKADSLVDHYLRISPEFKNQLIHISTEGQYQQQLSFTIHKIDNNSPSSDFATSFLKKNKILLASSGKSKLLSKRIHKWNNQAFLDIYIGDIDPSTGNISNLHALNPLINSKYHESTTSFNPQTGNLYFTRNNFIKGEKKTKDIIRLKIYRVTGMKKGNWNNLTELPFNSDTYSVANPALSANYKRLFFSSDMPGTIGSSDLFYVDILNDSTYGKPVNLGPKINTIGRESFPFIDNNGCLYFSSDGRQGDGGLDIYMALPDAEGNYGVPLNLGNPINSDADDFSFIVDADRHIGYFASNRNNYAFDDDIYFFSATPSPECHIRLHGLVTDAATQEVLPGVEISLYDVVTGKLNKKVRTDESGEYNLIINCNEIIRIYSRETNYLPGDSIVFIQPNISDLNINLQLTGLKLPEIAENKRMTDILKFQAIYFDFNKWTITPTAAVKLQQIILAMHQFPELKIQIISYADSRGDENYNYQLTEKRSEATAYYIISHGNISSDRFFTISKGEVRSESYGDTTKEIHQKNRRADFKIMTE